MEPVGIALSLAGFAAVPAANGPRPNPHVVNEDFTRYAIFLFLLRAGGMLPPPTVISFSVGASLVGALVRATAGTHKGCPYESYRRAPKMKGPCPPPDMS